MAASFLSAVALAADGCESVMFYTLRALPLWPNGDVRGRGGAVGVGVNLKHC